MNSRQFSRTAARCASRVAVVLSALGFVSMSLGISAGTIGQKDRSTPFPCMLSRCSCKTAADCWQSCCCHTLAERLAWARKRNIEPPAEVLAKAENGAPSQKRACCAEADVAGPNPTHCRKTATPAACCDSEPDLARSPASQRDDAVLSLGDGPKCSGVADTWSGLPPAVAIVQFEYQTFDAPGGAVSIFASGYRSALFTPPARPPSTAQILAGESK